MLTINVKWIRAICLLILSAVLLPALAFAEASPFQTIKVGIVEQEGYSKRDSNGTVRGRDAEYLARIAQYAHCHLAYSVYDTFADLLDALEKGEIDLAPGISQNPERVDKFLFSNKAIADGYVTIKVYAADDSYEYGDLTQIAGMTLGYISGSSDATAVSSWAEEMGIHVALASYISEPELRDALVSGKIDGVVSVDDLMTDCRTIMSVKAQSYYLAINRDRSDLKLLFDSAMNRLLEEMPMYAANLFYDQEKKHQDASIVLTMEQKAYLQAHTETPVRIAVIENDPPFNTTQNGECHGIIRDYYDQTAMLLNEIVPGFSLNYTTYSSFEDAVNAVVAGDADLLGMVRLSAVDASRYGLLLTSSLQSVNVMRLSLATNDPVEKPVIRAAVLSSDCDTLRYILGPDRSHYEWIEAGTLDEACQKLEHGSADVVLLSLPHATWLVNQKRSGSFYLMPLSYNGWELTGAVNIQNSELGDILSKAAKSRRVNVSAIISQDTATEQELLTFVQRIPLHIIILISAGITLVVALIIYLSMRTRHLKSVQCHNDALIRSQTELLHAYEYDSLTGLANRNTALHRANTDLQAGDQYCILLMSINNLGFVNESFGYEQGDKVIQILAARLLSYVRRAPEDRYVCRYSGDEFLFLVRGARLSEAKSMVDELREIGMGAIDLGDDVEVGPVYVWPHISFGIAESDGISGPEQIIQNCAIAANAAREDGTGIVRVYAEELKTELSRYNMIRAELIRALESDAFTMVYQPKVDLATGEMIGSEALVRVKGNRLSPGEFIPVAESSGYIQRIGRLTTQLVVRQLAQWREAGKRVQPVSINYSSNQLGDAGFVDYLLGLLEEYDVPAGLVQIEVTESLLLKRGEASDELFRRLQEAGIRLLLDDFGSGYSSLHYLSFIPVDIIKLDKSIVDDFLSDGSDNSFIRDLIVLLHGLGKKIIIEGVEKAWQVRKLLSYGCDEIQGFYFSRPLPPEALPEYALSEEQRGILRGAPIR